MENLGRRFWDGFEGVCSTIGGESRWIPSVLRFIVAANSKDRGTLISALQALESHIVIEHVAADLVKRVPIIRLHDAIYARERDLPLVRDGFTATFERLGFRLHVKDEA